MKTLKTLSFFLLITLLGCTTEEITNIYPIAEGLGKVNVYIEGDITNAEAQAQLEEEVGTLTENIFVRNTTQLTNITISAIGNMQNIVIKNTSNLSNATINAGGNLYDIEVRENTTLSNLEINGFNNSFANSLNIVSNTNLSIIEINEIKTINNFNLSYNGVAVNFTCHDLEEIKNTLSLYLRDDMDNTINFYDLKNVSLYSNDWNYWRGKYSILNFPNLEKINNLLLFDAISGGGVKMSEFTIPKLKEVNSIYCYFGLGVNTINLPLLEKCNNFYIRPVNNLNPTINIPNLNYCENFTIGTSGIESNKINTFLNKFLTVLPLSGKNIDFSEETAPTGQGLIDKQALINQGNTVLTN